MADSLYRQFRLPVSFVAASLLAALLLYKFGVLHAVGPIVGAPVSGPCGCGGECCQAEPPGMGADPRYPLPLEIVLEAPLPEGTLK